MADHLDAPGLKSPSLNARIDITDIYAFQKPDDPNKSILIMNVNPLAPTLADSFDHTALYELKIDTNGDAVAEVAFRIRFSPFVNGQQTATVRRVTGVEAGGSGTFGDIVIEHAPVSFGSTANITTSGDYKFFAGLRSDPFFFDLMGFLNNLQFTGADFFIDKNVFGIVLEVPNSALGSNPKIGVWGRVLLPKDPDSDDAVMYQADRMGRPTINTVFNKGEDKNLFNAVEPTQDRALFTQNVVKVLEALGNYSESDANAIAQVLLPDILTYDYSSSAGYLNGRKLEDDVIDINLQLVANNKAAGDKVGPHTDYLSTFPYMGNPHAVAAPAPTPSGNGGGGGVVVPRG
jgi:hypothetical protein